MPNIKFGDNGYTSFIYDDIRGFVPDSKNPPNVIGLNYQKLSVIENLHGVFIKETHIDLMFRSFIKDIKIKELDIIYSISNKAKEIIRNKNYSSDDFPVSIVEEYPNAIRKAYKYAACLGARNVFRYNRTGEWYFKDVIGVAITLHQLSCKFNNCEKQNINSVLAIRLL
jgi:hypothetical protein